MIKEDKALSEAALAFVKNGPQEGVKRVAVVGSRQGFSYQVVADMLEKVFEYYFFGKQTDIILVSGGARGVDSFAHEWGLNKGVAVAVFKPDWDTYGLSAGMRRNADIINNSDIVLAFWDGQSTGTLNSIERAKSVGKKIYIFDPSGKRISA